jgi:hypothetical protein
LLLFQPYYYYYYFEAKELTEILTKPVKKWRSRMLLRKYNTRKTKFSFLQGTLKFRYNTSSILTFGIWKNLKKLYSNV